jgi:hypothetical protein
LQMRISHIVLDPTLAMLTETGVTDLKRKTSSPWLHPWLQCTKINEKWCTAFVFLERAPYE